MSGDRSETEKRRTAEREALYPLLEMEKRARYAQFTHAACLQPACLFRMTAVFCIAQRSQSVPAASAPGLRKGAAHPAGGARKLHCCQGCSGAEAEACGEACCGRGQAPLSTSARVACTGPCAFGLGVGGSLRCGERCSGICWGVLLDRNCPFTPSMPRCSAQDCRTAHRGHNGVPDEQRTFTVDSYCTRRSTNQDHTEKHASINTVHARPEHKHREITYLEWKQGNGALDIRLGFGREQRGNAAAEIVQPTFLDAAVSAAAGAAAGAAAAGIAEAFSSAGLGGSAGFSWMLEGSGVRRRYGRIWTQGQQDDNDEREEQPRLIRRSPRALPGTFCGRRQW